jgi:hypothetical protein
VKSDSQYFLGFSGVEQHFYGDPIRKPANEGGNKGYQDQPIIHQSFFGKVSFCR